MGELWLQHRLSSLFSWIQFTVEYRYIEARPWGSLPQDLLYRSVKSRFHCTVEGLSLARFLVTVFSSPPNSFQYYLCTSNANYFNNSAIFTKACETRISIKSNASAFNSQTFEACMFRYWYLLFISFANDKHSVTFISSLSIKLNWQGYYTTSNNSTRRYPPR